MSLYQITAPHFCAGVVTATRKEVETVVHAAPVLKWAVGKPFEYLLCYCLRKRWQVTSDLSEHG